MTKRAFFVLLSLLLAPAAVSAIGLSANGRPFHFHIPPQLPAGPRPLVILLHGYQTDATQQEAYLQIKAETDPRGVYYAYLDGTRDGAGRPFWNGAGCCQILTFPAAPIPDVEYIDAVLDRIIAAAAERHPASPVDPNRIFIIGHSNGAFMAHRYACERPRVAAIATLSGAQWNGCPAVAPSRVSVLHIHATNDILIPFYGRSIAGIEVVKGARRTVWSWFLRNGCTGPNGEFTFMPNANGNRIDLASSITGFETEQFAPPDSSCPSDGKVELWQMNGPTVLSLSGHIPTFWPGVFARRTIDWLMAHPKLP